MGSHQRGHSEDAVNAGLWLDVVKQGAEIGGGNCLVAANNGIGVAVLHHQRAEVMRAGDRFLRIHLPIRAVAGHVFRPLHEKGQIRRGLGIDDADELEGNLILRRKRPDARDISQQNGRDSLQRDHTRGGLDHA